MFANAPLSDSQIVISTLIISATLVYPLILLVLGGLACVQNRNEGKVVVNAE